LDLFTILVACLSPRRSGFELGPVRVILVEDKMARGEVFPGTTVFPSHFHHCTNAPYSYSV